MLASHLRFLSAAIILAALSSPSFANNLAGSHPDVIGDSVEFTEIEEFDVSTSPIAQLFFGPGEGLGDMLLFAPPDNFNSLSNDRELDFKDGRLSMRISSLDGSLFSGITINESGAYNVTGFASSRVDLVGSVVTEEGIFNDAVSFEQSGAGQGQWNLFASYAFPATDEAILVLDNQLLTVAAEGIENLAFIDKKVVEITVVPAIPEPSSLAFIGLATGFGMIRRRRVAR